MDSIVIRRRSITPITLGRVLDRVNIGSKVNPSHWTTYISGLIVYRRGINDLTNLYELQYSSDGGSAWETLISQLTDENTILQDKNNLYRHRIVGTAYHIDQALTEIGYAGIENTDWENIFLIQN